MEETLKSIQTDVRDCKTILTTLEKQLSPELHMIKTPEEALTLFAHLTKLVVQGNQIELIIRRI